MRPHACASAGSSIAALRRARWAWSLLLYGLLGDPGRRQRHRVGARLRRGADDLRLRAAGADARAAAEPRDRQAARAHPRPHRPARARERAPPAAAHRDHRLGADDRRRARRVRGDLRRRPARDDRPGHRRAGARRRHRHPRGRLLAAAGRRRPRRSSRSTASPAVSPMRFETGRLVERAGNTGGHRHRSDATVRRGAAARLGRRARTTCCRSLGSNGAAISKDFAETHDLAVGDSVRFLTPRGNEVTYDGRRASTTRRQASSAARGQQRVARARLGVQGHRVRARGVRAGHRRPRRSSSAEESSAGGLPDRQAADDRGLQGRAERAGQRARLASFYALLALSVIVALLGDRQHARAVGARAHARAGHAARGRHGPRPGAADGRGESVITAVIGAVLGVVLGIAFAAIVSRPLADEGFVFEIPIVSADRRRPSSPRWPAWWRRSRPPAGREGGRAEGCDNRVGG